MKFVLNLPVPPSVNAMYANRYETGRRHQRGPGRYKTRAYKAWIQEAGWTIWHERPRPILGQYKLLLSLGKIRGDPDNRLKAVNDLLVDFRLVEDDKSKYCIDVRAHIVPEIDKKRCLVTVEKVETDYQEKAANL